MKQREKKNWTDKQVNTIIKINYKNFLKDCFWLLDCEEDCLKTNGFDSKVVDNLRNRFKGHFKPK